MHPVVAADPLEGDQVSKLALVRATGRRGVVIRHDPKDLLLPFKARSQDFRAFSRCVRMPSFSVTLGLMECKLCCVVWHVHFTCPRTAKCGRKLVVVRVLEQTS